MNNLIAAVMIATLGPIIPQNTLKVAVETAVNQAAAYTDSVAKRPYTLKRRLNTYLYEFQYDTYDIEKIKTYFLKEFKRPNRNVPTLSNFRKLGGCSGLRNGNFFGRNFDWMYDNSITAVIRVPADETIGRQASIGVAYVAGLTEEVVKSDVNVFDYNLVPFRTVDGINDSGVYIQDNVVPPGDYDYTVSTNPGAKHRVPAMLAVRYVLDYATNAVHACELIKNDLDLYGFYTDKVQDEIHYLIADSNNTFIVESISNRIEVIDVAERPIITNFHIWNTVVKDGAIDMNTVTPHANGTERYNILLANKDSATSLEGMMNVMKMVEYTKTYSSEPFWYSELYGGAYTKDTPVEEFEMIRKYMLDAYKERDRKTPYKGVVWTWQTCHCSVYDLEHRMLWLVDQERDSSTGAFFLLHPERINPINN